MAARNLFESLAGGVTCMELFDKKSHLVFHLISSHSICMCRKSVLLLTATGAAGRHVRESLCGQLFCHQCHPSFSVGIHSSMALLLFYNKNSTVTHKCTLASAPEPARLIHLSEIMTASKLNFPEQSFLKWHSQNNTLRVHMPESAL